VFQTKSVSVKTVQAGMIEFCLPEKKALFKQKITVFSYVYNTLPHLTAFDSLIKNQSEMSFDCNSIGFFDIFW
jgi:hypothetical protein